MHDAEKKVMVEGSRHPKYASMQGALPERCLRGVQNFYNSPRKELPRTEQPVEMNKKAEKGIFLAASISN
jgi:hypothetical protein